MGILEHQGRGAISQNLVQVPVVGSDSGWAASTDLIAL
jgi:hypothetical protein